jgi:hypothetical protein
MMQILRSRLNVEEQIVVEGCFAMLQFQAPFMYIICYLARLNAIQISRERTLYIIKFYVQFQTLLVEAAESELEVVMRLLVFSDLRGWLASSQNRSSGRNCTRERAPSTSTSLLKEKSSSSTKILWERGREVDREQGEKIAG